ncbi:MAG: hypothetical protein V1936_02345 [Patescibacteria group bacterium]
MTDQTTTTAFTPLPDESKSGGTPLAQIATKQVAITREDMEKFGISEELAKSNPVLVDLILKTESMKDEERKYWFQLLPAMTEEQVAKLQNILQNERDQLTELDKKYASEIDKLNAQPKWDPTKFKAKRQKVEEAEKEAQQVEQADEKNILNQLDNL